MLWQDRIADVLLGDPLNRSTKNGQVFDVLGIGQELCESLGDAA